MSTFIREFYMKDITWIQPYYHLILDRVPRDATTFLDVGAGSGIFGFILTRTRDVKQLDAIEPFGYELDHFNHVFRMTWKEWYSNQPSIYDVLNSRNKKHMMVTIIKYTDV